MQEILFQLILNQALEASFVIEAIGNMFSNSPKSQ